MPRSKREQLDLYYSFIFQAHDLYHDCSLGININLAIVRLIRLEYEENEVSDDVSPF